MTDHQTSPVGEDAATEFEAWWEREGQYIRAGGGDYEKSFAYGAWNAGRAAPALGADELPVLPKHLVEIDQSDDEMWGELQDHAWDSDYANELKLGAPLYTAEQVRQAQRDAHTTGLDAGYALAQEAIENLKDEISDLRAQLAAARQVGKHLFDAVADGAAPTQPKAQVGASIDTPEFRMLEADFVKESVELSTKDNHADNTGLYAARTALIAHIDAWAGSRAGDAAQNKRITDALNTTLWLYRRLPACYGSPPFVDASIIAFADVLGIDAPAAIKERVTLHAGATGKQEGA